MFWKHALIFTNSFSPRFGNTPFLESNTIEINQNTTQFKYHIGKLDNSLEITIPKITRYYYLPYRDKLNMLQDKVGTLRTTPTIYLKPSAIMSI